MPALSTKSAVQDFAHFPMAEVDDFGQIDLATLASGNHRTAMTKVTLTKQMDRPVSMEIIMDTNQFEHPPVFTIELNEAGPKIYVHGIDGELAATLTIHDDGSMEMVRI